MGLHVLPKREAQEAAVKEKATEWALAFIETAIAVINAYLVSDEELALAGYGHGCSGFP